MQHAVFNESDLEGVGPDRVPDVVSGINDAQLLSLGGTKSQCRLCASTNCIVLIDAAEFADPGQKRLSRKQASK